MTARHYAGGTYKTKKPRSPCFGKGGERQAACTNTPWPRERGEDGVPSPQDSRAG
ncbi:MAG: hypothetical protein J6P84_06470 [Alphaproteobacteria bacterium]|nr:hypothetical protein [Alphaproteobacteria bacterium]